MPTLPPLPRRTPNRIAARDHAASPGPRIQEAADARDALAEALAHAGIQLPAMDVRTPWADAASDEAHRDGVPASARYALVHLGVCSAPVAFALAAVIAKGTAR